MTIVQLELRLWPDRDPNLHRNGIYPFEVTAEALLTALNLIGASSDSISEVEVKLSDSTLWCAIKLKNGTFGAVAPVALPGRTQIGATPVRFSVKGHPLYKIAKYFAGPISFEFDRNAAKLHVNNGRTNLAPFHVIPLPVEEADDEGRSLGQILVPSDLHDGSNSHQSSVKYNRRMALTSRAYGSLTGASPAVILKQYPATLAQAYPMGLM